MAFLRPDVVLTNGFFNKYLSQNQSQRHMSVLIETSLGEIVVDLYVKEAPRYKKSLENVTLGRA